MNILFPFVGDSVGGSHWSAINLFVELKKNKVISPKIVLHISDSPLSSLLDKMHIPYDSFPLNNFSGQSSNLINISFLMLFHAPLIIKYIKDNDIDIVHGNDLRINLTWAMPTKLSSAKYVWHQRTHLSNSIKWNAIHYLSDFVVSISSYVHNSLPSNLIRVSTECVKNPFDTETIYSKKISREAINTEYPFLKDVFLLGYVGRIVPWKRIENILYALQKVVFHTNDTYKVYLIITGEGDTNYVNQIANLIQFLGLNDCVIMTGFVSNPSVTLAALDLLIASSYNEPFGRVVVEAMIQKTPVLASKSGGHIETVVHNKTGLLYEKSSSNLLAEYICRVMSKNIDINPIVDVAYKEVVLEYSASKHSDKMISIYMKLVHG